MRHIRSLLFLFLLTLPASGFSQLADFNFNAASTDETCNSNGKIEMAVSNTTDGAVVTYRLFLAPEFEIHIAATLTSVFLTLPAGNYRVVATQSKDGLTNSKQRDVTINNLIEKLDFELIESVTTSCDVTATLTVNVLAGDPTFYEIISGPVTRPLQESNQFSNLPSGTYVVRAFDSCNDALSITYSFFVGNNNLTIGAPVLPQIYASCDFVVITNSIASNGSNGIQYPLEVTYTVSEPSGSTSQVITRTIISGASNLLVLEQEINLFNTLFTVRIEITDNCGTVFSNLFTIDPRPRITIQRQAAACGELFFRLQVRNYAPPFTLNFSNPSNFDPTLFNPSYPGPFTSSPVVFGSAANTVPFGDYSVTVQERCGRTRQLNFLIEDKPINPAVTFFNNGCNSDFGSVKISMPDNRSIVGITLIEAPVAYPNALPANVIGSVNGQGVYNNTSLHVGVYTYVVVDSCGDTHTVALEVPAFVFGNLVATTRPDCSPTSGGVRISTSNGALVSIKITAAPVTFENPLSYDVSFNIDSNGIFYMSGLPAGSYSFEAIDSCGYVLTTTAEIAGYTRNSDGFLLNRTCTFFDLTLNNTDATITGKRFWLQKFFPATNSWGHPALGTAFVEGTIPTSATAIELFNFQTLTNSLLVGKLRVIKVFDSYNNGNPNGSCSDLYVEFDIISELVIFGTYNLSCNDASLPNDVVIDVQGAPPFTFAMTSPLAINNGEDNTFLDLEDGNYIFQVTDICGNIKNIPLNIGNLLPLVRANAPKSMLVCRNDGVQFGVFPLVNQTLEILGTQNPNTYVVSFYLTQSDADNALNALPDGYTNISNPQTIYVRVQHKTILLCFATTSFAIFAGITPILSPEQPLYLCEGFTKILTAEAGYSSYLWSTGETTASITINAAGTYTVIVSNLYQDFSCDKVKNFIVTGSNRATILKIDTSDWTSSQNAVVVSVTGLGIYAYSLDNINFQTSNIFENLPAGTYRVYVKEVNGCGTVNAEFVLLNYPKFFTPNADGYNDTWHIQFSNFEPNLTVVIFDRFGKLITRLQSGDAGWDGMYNGQTLPSTDYWFAVTRQNGTIYKGHFSLRR